ncbi:peptide-methionine (S)-S-oxide reductase [uncultured Croceitalea sp.]|uniref:peptide-methionine (S)-S-oxide reductase n=1 Tax=uncultured Croceitalea sp. TaxID=1798908 RepID=UPI00374F8E97
MEKITKIGFGGGCHWCTEAVFQSLRGVYKVEQGFIAQEDKDGSFSEAVIVSYNAEEIPLKVLIEVHLNTHKSTSAHSMRTKYRSAIYTFNESMFKSTVSCLEELQSGFDQKLITQVYSFKEFKHSKEEFHNYFYSNPEKPFCKTYIKPKLKLLLKEFAKHADANKINMHHKLI